MVYLKVSNSGGCRESGKVHSLTPTRVGESNRIAASGRTHTYLTEMELPLHSQRSPPVTGVVENPAVVTPTLISTTAPALTSHQLDKSFSSASRTQVSCAH